MHEWAFAEGIIKTVEEEAIKNRFKKLSKIYIVMGELQGIDKDIVSFALENLKKGTIMEKAVFEFKDEEMEFECRNCGFVWKIDRNGDIDELIKESIHFVPEAAHSFISCPECGSKDFEITKGRGVYISRIDGEL